jgi:hypothetical protein
MNSDRNRGHSTYTPGSGQTVTGLHLSPPREAGPLTHSVVFHTNSFLLEGNKIIRINLAIFGGVDFFFVLSIRR